MTRIHDTWADNDNPLKLELYYGAAWHDITADLSEDGWTVDRNSPGPDQFACKLKNTTGTYCPKNANSSLYGWIGRNTPIRASVVFNSVTYVRFYGEVSSWPQRWTTRGNAYAPIQAAGIRRRLGQGASPLRSAFYRGMTSAISPIADLVAYWPMEDGIEATYFAGGPTTAGASSSTAPMRISSGTANPSSDSSFLCSDSLPTGGTAIMGANVGAYTTGTIHVVGLLMKVPAGTPDNSPLVTFYSQGSVTKWQLEYNTGGAVTLRGYDNSGTQVLSTGAVTLAVDGINARFSMYYANNIGTGALDYAVTFTPVGATVASGLGGSLAASANTNISRVVLNAGGTSTNVVYGHVHVLRSTTSSLSYYNLIKAHRDETADDRVNRLCAEEGVSITTPVDPLTPMGTQRPKTLLDLLDEVASSDGGMLMEDRSGAGLVYRSLDSLCAQAPAATIAYTDNLLLPFESEDDDKLTRNRVTIQRDGGTSNTYEVASGPLSVQPPPLGVGVYDTSATLSLAGDDQAVQMSSWLAHVGTVDESRWPRIGIELAHPTFTADDALTASILGTDLGDRLVVTDLPTWMPPDDVDQLVIAYTEAVTPKRYKITVDAVPSAAYWAGVYDDAASRYEPALTTTNGSVTTTGTTLHVWNRDKSPFTHDDGDCVITVGGEDMTVTAVADDGFPLNPLNANPYFNSGISDWYSPTGSTIAAEAGTVHEGAGSLKLTTVATADNRAECNAYWIRVNNDSDYLVGNFVINGWLRCTSAIQVSVRINWYAAGLVYIRSDIFSNVVAANTWTQIPAAAEAPSDAVYANIGAGVDGSPGAGKVLYVDELTMCRYSSIQSLTVTRSVNGVVAAHGDHEEVHLKSPVRYIP